MSERVGSAADAELVELLERRASRAKVDRGLVERVVAAVATERQARPSPFGRVALSAERARRAVGAVAIVAAVVSLVGAALFVGAGAAKKADEPSASPSPAQQTATRFTSVDFLRFLHEQPDAFIGHTVLVDGTLNEDLLYQCPAVGCPRHFGGSSTGDPAVVPIDAQAAASIGSTPSGTFAIQVHSASDVRLVGRVQAPPTGEFWQPHALRGRPATGSDVYLVDGYFGGVSGMGCDLVLVVPTWCPTTWISDTPDETATSDDGIPATALRVPADIPRSRGVPALHPHVEILVRPAPEGTCAANPTCQASDPENLWLVAATVEPVTLDVRSSPEP